MNLKEVTSNYSKLRAYQWDRKQSDDDSPELVVSTGWEAAAVPAGHGREFAVDGFVD